jgi:hypothetical protein
MTEQVVGKNLLAMTFTQKQQTHLGSLHKATHTTHLKRHSVQNPTGDEFK